MLKRKIKEKTSKKPRESVQTLVDGENRAKDRATPVPGASSGAKLSSVIETVLSQESEKIIVRKLIFCRQCGNSPCTGTADDYYELELQYRIGENGDEEFVGYGKVKYGGYGKRYFCNNDKDGFSERENGCNREHKHKEVMRKYRHPLSVW